MWSERVRSRTIPVSDWHCGHVFTLAKAGRLSVAEKGGGRLRSWVVAALLAFFDHGHASVAMPPVGEMALVERELGETAAHCTKK